MPQPIRCHSLDISLFITLNDHPVGNLPFVLSFFAQLPLVRIQYK